jgi:hypothetical protein
MTEMNSIEIDIEFVRLGLHCETGFDFRFKVSSLDS